MGGVTVHDIEFRGKRTDNGEWVYGNLVRGCNEQYAYIVEFGNKELCRNYVDINPETVGQYTGLKDKNGTKIFDGDIVLVPYVDPIFKCAWDDTSLSERAIVRYVDGMFYVEYIESGDKFTLSVMKGHMKIVGNIYDNPELW